LVITLGASSDRPGPLAGKLEFALIIYIISAFTFPAVAHVAAVAALEIVASGTLFVAAGSGPGVDGQLTNNCKS
jgi:hypothetical protein